MGEAKRSQKLEDDDFDAIERNTWDR